jgi:hypothetical protein
VALVGAVLDFTADTLPVLLEGVVTLDDVLEPETPSGVADLLASQHVNATIDVFSRDLRLDLLETEEVLLVKRAQALEPHLQFVDRVLELFRLHLGLTRLARLGHVPAG